MQWRDLERITKENEEQKAVPVYLYHNPEDYPSVHLCADSTVEKGRIYLGPYASWNKTEDMTYKQSCKKLQLENERLKNELWVLKDKIERVKDLL